MEHDIITNESDGDFEDKIVNANTATDTSSNSFQ